MLNGLKREREIGDNLERRGGISRIVIRYADGRKVFVTPDAGSGTFSEDDAKELKKVFDSVASTVEWSEVATRSTM